MLAVRRTLKNEREAAPRSLSERSSAWLSRAANRLSSAWPPLGACWARVGRAVPTATPVLPAGRLRPSHGELRFR